MNEPAVDPAVVSALAALAGSLIGASASVLTSWLTQRAQNRSQITAADRSRRESLYSEFIDQASRLYGKALEADHADVSDMVGLLALVNRIRLYADAATISEADAVIENLMDAYYAPPIHFAELKHHDRNAAVNPLAKFSALAREELARIQ